MKEAGHVQAHTFCLVSGLNDMFAGNGVQQGLRHVFSCLVGVSSIVYIRGRLIYTLCPAEFSSYP